VLTFRDIDAEQASDVEPLVRWVNDTEIRHLSQQFESEGQSLERLSLDTPRLQRMLKRAIERGKRVQLLEWQGKIVGEITVEMDASQLFEALPHTAWFGIIIGEEHARGRGLGHLAMQHLEDLAKTLGAKHAQIGVFEFNAPARRLYEKLGYKELTIIPEFTWWKGKRWSDIRMGKPL
jgi:RimJ/RimL family protein N-acetyltransferase